MSLAELSQSVLALSRSVDRLDESVRAFGFRAPNQEPWYELLKHKVVRQLSKRPFLVVAVMGGTNTGKSVVFNHLAGENASAADHRAAGTKNPVCLIPHDTMIGDGDKTDSFNPSTYDQETPEELLHRHFDAFRILPWTKPEDPLQESREHHLFWRVGKNVPTKLLLLDTPDIDSDTPVNWERAREVRETSDLIIAVLTEQKYADAAVKRFFREASAAGKPVILLFNMVDIEHDLEEVPRWVKQFREETGTEPVDVLIAPHDRDAANGMNLSFSRLSGPQVPAREMISVPNLSDLLSELHFEKIKTQTLHGALKVICDRETGATGYLRRMEAESKSWGDARKTLENAEGIEITWPGLPSSLLIDEIRGWWETGRSLWTRRIHNTYRTVGNAILWPIQKAWNSFSNKPVEDPMLELQKQEAQTVTLVVEKTIEQLERLAKTDNPVLRESLQGLLTGENRKNLLDHAKAAHKSLVPIDDDFRNFLRDSLQQWSEENPGAVKVVRSLDFAAAIARPAITITLAATGFAFVGSLASHAVIETAITGGLTGTGEVLVNQAGEGIKQSVAKLFQSVQEEYAKNRARHFFNWFQRELWGTLLIRLEQGEQVVQTQIFRDVREAANRVGDLYEKECQSTR